MRALADLTAQADILGLAAAPALEFDDPESASDYLALLRAKLHVVDAAIYAPNGSLFASYTMPPEASLPPLPELDGYGIEGGRSACSSASRTGTRFSAPCTSRPTTAWWRACSAISASPAP